MLRIPTPILILLLATTFVQVSRSQSLRLPRDIIGFCRDAGQTTRLISFLDSLDREEIPLPGNTVAAISPHDDYLYAGRMYHPLFRHLRAKEVVIFGVTHRTVRNEIGDPRNVLILDTHDSWYSPFGPIAPSPLREYLHDKLDTSVFIVSNKAQELEHSIEALLPFLQYYNRDVRITPIMVTAMPFERMDEISSKLAPLIQEYLRQHSLVPGKDIVFLVSSDANHYGRDFNNLPFGEDRTAHETGTRNDRRIARDYLEGGMSAERIKALTKELESVVWCGKYSVPFGMLTIEKILATPERKKLSGAMLRYSDTFTEMVLPMRGTDMGTTAPVSLKHWVGFFSMAFSLK